MSGLGMVLNTAKGAIAAQQYSLNVTGHNIANVGTDGFSRQSMEHTSTTPISIQGYQLGTGVNPQQVQRTVNELLEKKLAVQDSLFSMYEESDSYMRIVENYFNENSEDSLSNLLSEYWNSWHDLANNPTSASDRVALYESGNRITTRLNNLDADMSQMELELTREIESAASDATNIAGEIAALNLDIISSEALGSANDQRDQRQNLIRELSSLININSFEQKNGAMTISTSNGVPLVYEAEAYGIDVIEGAVLWNGSNGTTLDITDQISSGKIAGWLKMRDENLAKYKTDLNMVTRQLIWATNYQHTQGSGVNYFSAPVKGHYESGQSELFSTLSFGQQIDYTKDFKMWISNVIDQPPVNTSLTMDMDISEAEVSNWTGLSGEEDYSKYVLNVIASGSSGSDENIAITNGHGLGVVHVDNDIASALDRAIGDTQTISVEGEKEIQTVIIKGDGTGDAIRSAKSISDALNALDGVTAKTLENSVSLNITGLMDSINNAHANDLVTFDLVSKETTETISFRVDVINTVTRANFLESLDAAILKINGGTEDLTVNTSDFDINNIVTLTSASGENIGVENFDVQDLSIATLNNFANFDAGDPNTAVNISNFSNFSNGESSEFTITSAMGTVTIDYTITNASTQTTLADDFETAMTAQAAALAGIGVGVARVGDTFDLTGSATARYMDFTATTSNPDTNDYFSITPAAGSAQFPEGGNTELLFDGSGDLEQFAADNSITFDLVQLDSLAAPVNTNSITIDLRRIDTADAAAVTTAFYNGLNGNVDNAIIANTGGVLTITALNENASNFRLENGQKNGANSATTNFDLSVPGAAIAADNFAFAGVASADFLSLNETDFMDFDNARLVESGGTGSDSALKTGIVNIFMEPGLQIESNVDGAGVSGTIGGDYIANGFDAGDTISFALEFAGSSIANINFLAGATNTLIADEISRDLNAGAVMANGSRAKFNDNEGNEIIITRNGDTFDFITTGNQIFTINDFVDNDGSGSGNPATFSLTANADSEFSEGYGGTRNFAAGPAGAGTLAAYRNSEGSIFNVNSDTSADMGKTIMTLGGKNGLTGFDAGDSIYFKLDDTYINYTVDPIDTTEEMIAKSIEDAIYYSGVDTSNYTISRNGSQLSIMKKDGTLIDITEYSYVGTGDKAKIVVQANTVLDANIGSKDNATSKLIGTSGMVEWIQQDIDGNSTGDSGVIKITDAGTYVIDENITFDMSKGSIVAGNTLTINTDSDGQLDTLNVTAKNTANAILDTYTFTAQNTGKLGIDDVEIAWKTNSGQFGTFILEKTKGGYLPITAEVDGMTLNFNAGTMFRNDVFTMVTDKDGAPTITHPDDWHWTMTSFTDQFNRQAAGVKASVNSDKTITIEETSDDNEITNIAYSGKEGFSEENVTISVSNYEIMKDVGTNFRVVRDAELYSETGGWAVPFTNNLGYDVNIYSVNGFDLDEGIHIDLDGKRAMTINFDKAITGNGEISFDIAQVNGEYTFAFSDTDNEDSGVTAALGINTFFTGDSSQTIETNSRIADSDNIAAAKLSSANGNIGTGNNTNALLASDLQYQTANMAKWNFTRGSAPTSDNATTTIEGFHTVMIGSLGIESVTIKRALDFNEVMKENIEEQRDTISAVSLDEEMIKMIKYQHAFSAASKLITVSDEMLTTLLSVR